MVSGLVLKPKTTNKGGTMPRPTKDMTNKPRVRVHFTQMLQFGGSDEIAVPRKRPALPLRQTD